MVYSATHLANGHRRHSEQLASHGIVQSSASQAAIVWKEFDGTNTSIPLQRSLDNGLSWSATNKIATDTGTADYPFLLSHKDNLYLSWYSENRRYQLLKVDQ
ncbi:MAG TPA: hypothetical protein ENJ32_03870 [Crenotrichaceae bacterium]|nr:hypothetical protein [Crenotrichaceae bacterium]